MGYAPTAMVGNSSGGPGPERMPALFEAIAAAADKASIGVAVTTHQPELRNVWVNDAATTLLGYSREELLGGMNPWDMIAPEDLERLRTRHDNVIREVQSSRGSPSPPVNEVMVVTKNGTRVPMEYSSSHVTIDGNVATVSFFRDISDRLRGREERERMQQQLAQADRMAAVGLLAAGVAHEVNNPLAYVLLNLQLLERDLAGFEASPPPEQLEQCRERLALVRQGVDRIATIVRDLRTFSRGDEHRRSPVDLGEVLEFAVRMAASETQSRASVELSIGEAPPVLANQARLEQVFLNLIVNAVQAMDEQRVAENRVRVSVRRLGAEDGSDPQAVMVEVADNGSGVDEGAIDRVFDPFFTTKSQGTGLGLSISRSIVKSLGGQITVENLSGGGAAFRVVLPAAPSSVVPRRTMPAPDQAAGGLRLLVVDDEPSVADALRAVLAERHRVTAVTSAAHALDLVSAGVRFDALVCDLAMPGMSGIELHERLGHVDPELARRTIFMTGIAGSGEADFLAVAGNPSLQKPFDLDDLDAALAHVASDERLAPLP
jgi:PAS domain S-box-containing protein